MTRLSGRYELGKLRSFGTGLGADLGEWLGWTFAGRTRSHCDSPLFPARAGAPAVRRPADTWCQETVRDFILRRRRRHRSDNSPVATEMMANPAHIDQLLRSLMSSPRRRNPTVVRPHQTTNQAAAPVHVLLPFTGQR